MIIEDETGIILRLTAFSELGSQVSIVPDYRLDDWGSIPAEIKDFSSNLCVQTSSEAHPASYRIGIGGHFPGIKRGRGVRLTTQSHLALRSRMSRIYASSSFGAFMA
jgi:hypothetical protein